jgi:hypothetical protein
MATQNLSVPAAVPRTGELDDLREFDDAVRLKDPGERFQPNQMIRCPKCGDLRRVKVLVRYKPSRTSLDPPVLCSMSCVQCDTVFTAVVYPGASGPSLAILLSTYGGLTTPHTPSGVAYYLDQAQKAHSVGANSAAIAMFRGALEHLLYDQGFKTGMCGKKLLDLEAAITAGTAPKWAAELDTEFLSVMKQLGDGAIHPNDGDVTKQGLFDNALVFRVRHIFELLLFLIYEVPHKKAERLQALKTAVIKK